MGAAALAALELLGKAVDTHVEEQRAEKAHERNQELMTLQNRYQIEQWNRENAYNNPLRVASRFRSAGINPRAVFGSGTATGAGIAGGLSSAPSGGSHSPMSSDKFSGLSGIFIQDEKIKNERLAIDAQSEKTKEETRGLRIENKYKEESQQLQLRSQLTDIYKKLSEIDKNSSERALLLKQAQEIEQKIKESEERIANMEQERKESQSRIQKNEQDVEESRERQRRSEIENAWLARFGWKPGDSWLSAATAFLGRFVVQGDKLTDRFMAYLKSLFKKDVSPDVAKKVVPILNSSMSDADKQSKINEILNKNGYNDRFE